MAEDGKTMFPRLPNWIGRFRETIRMAVKTSGKIDKKTISYPVLKSSSTLDAADSSHFVKPRILNREKSVETVVIEPIRGKPDLNKPLPPLPAERLSKWRGSIQTIEQRETILNVPDLDSKVAPYVPLSPPIFADFATEAKDAFEDMVSEVKNTNTGPAIRLLGSKANTQLGRSSASAEMEVSYRESNEVYSSGSSAGKSPSLQESYVASSTDTSPSTRSSDFWSSPTGPRSSVSSESSEEIAITVWARGSILGKTAPHQASVTTPSSTAKGNAASSAIEPAEITQTAASPTSPATTNSRPKSPARNFSYPMTHRGIEVRNDRNGRDGL